MAVQKSQRSKSKKKIRNNFSKIRNNFSKIRGLTKIKLSKNILDKVTNIYVS